MLAPFEAAASTEASNTMCLWLAFLGLPSASPLTSYLQNISALKRCQLHYKEKKSVCLGVQMLAVVEQLIRSTGSFFISPRREEQGVVGSLRETGGC